MYTCTYFKIYELVDPLTYEQLGEKAWHFFDPAILKAADNLRGAYGKTTINDWYWGGDFKWSGYRSPDCKIGAKLSMHRLWRALDLKPQEITAGKIKGHILKAPEASRFAGINRVESGVSWLHIDSANAKPITFFNP